MKGPRIAVPRFVSLVIAASLLAGLSFAVLAPAKQQRPDRQRHLLLVPTDAEGTAALARTDARVLARYQSFSVVEAQGRDDERLRSAGAERRDDMVTVETAAGELDPATERASLAGKDARDREEALALVQFVGPPKQAWVQRLAQTGARVVTYQAENAYVVHARGAAVDRVAALQGRHPAVRAVSLLTSADKLEDRTSGSGEFAVTTVAGSAGADARAQAAQAGAVAAAPVTVRALRTEYRALSSTEAAELARDPGVVAIEASSEPKLLDERAAQIVAGNLNASFAPTTPTYHDWLVGTQGFPTTTFDFAIDVTDEGLDNGALLTAHNDFREHGTGPTTRVSYMANYTSDADARDCGGHGTNVASLAAGYNLSNGSQWEDAPSFNHGLGVAPFARVGASKIFDCAGNFSSTWTPASQAAAAYSGNARVSNNSWGIGNLASWGNYTARSAAYDQLVRDARPTDAGNQGLVEVFAAGNDGDGTPGSSSEGYGTISAEGSAKNVITVGASEGVRQSGPDGCGVTDAGANSARDIIDFSSRGPTDDGRLKPDLVAPGTHATGAAPQHAGYTNTGVCNPFFTGTTWYSLVSGTSQAAPQVSGSAALLRDWFQRTQPGGAVPSPALTKALLVNTATDLAGGDNGKGDTIAPGPNTDQGWGRVNLGNVFDSTARELRDQLPADILGSSGQSRMRAYAVQDTGRPVKVTLAWTDAPGPTTGSPVVNDLDLVVDAGGRTYQGNVFAGAFSRTGGTADRLNNVESVYLPAGTGGRLAVKVVGANIPGDGIPGNSDSTDQDFALVVSNATEQSSPVLVHEQTALDDSPAAGGDGDGALETGESFELDERLRNAGNAGATGLSGTLRAASGLTITQGTSTWPNIAAGASQPNDTSFAGQVTASCGQDSTATLALTTVEGPHTVPLTLPTGTEGAPVTLSQTHTGSGLAIPDDSAAGATSTINVPTPGRIKDLDVRIADIDHGWVGDLQIEISSPDGTTVRLADHPGGPDNGGKNMVDTVFDDEAPTTIAAGSAPYTGRFRPQNDQLSRFDGKQQQGTWTLRVRDLFEGDTGTLDVWRLDRSPAVCTVDPAAPETTIDSGPDQGSTVSNAGLPFSFSSDVPGATFECQIDGAPFATCTSPYIPPGLSNGTHTFRVRAKNGPSVDQTPATRTWTLDTSPPETTITSGPSGRIQATDATFQFVSPDTPGATFQCSIDGGTQSLCTDPRSFTGLSEGTHTFRVEAWDQAGNVDPTPASRTWTIDRTAPTVSINSPGALEVTTDVTPAISGTASTAINDSSTVTVKVYDGPTVAGPPIRTHTTTRSAGGAWSVDVAPSLPAGQQYTARAEQADDTAPPNVGQSSPVTFTIGPDHVPPDTTIESGPGGVVASDSATFSFSSDEVNARFECSLDGAAFAACSSSHHVSGLADGTHTIAIRAIDPAENPDPNPATRAWTVDTTPPSLAITSPTSGQRLADSTPSLRGTAGTAARDAGTVTVKLWSGTLAAGMPAQMIVVPRDGASGAWSAAPAALGVGTWTVQAEQSDSAGNVGASAASTFIVDAAAPSFVLAPAEERTADALAGRLTVIAACASACQVRARMTVSARAARNLGLGGRSTALGSGRKKLTKAGTAATAVRLTKRAKSALRRRAATTATLRVTVTQGAEKLTLSRTISLRRSAGLRRIATRGLQMWAACSATCRLSGTLSLPASAASRIGLNPRGSAPMRVASGRTTAVAGEPARLTLKVRRGARKALGNATRIRGVLEAVAGAASGPRRTAARNITLRR